MMTLFQEGGWVWVRTGEPLDFSAWGPGEPNNLFDGEDCLHLEYNKNYKWNDYPCFTTSVNYAWKPICQKDITTFNQ